MSVFTVEKPNASDYVIDGAADPTLELVRGQTYTFDFVDNGHPFYIKSALGSGTTGRYDTGVVNQGSSLADADLVFTVPQDAPDILYYQCSAHYGMNGELRLTSEETPAPVEATESTLRVIVASGQLGADAVMLEGVTETRSDDSWTLEYAGTVYDYAAVASVIATVTRDDEYTESFAAEIADAYPEYAGISLTDTVALVGSAALNDTLLEVANADGNSIG